MADKATDDRGALETKVGDADNAFDGAFDEATKLGERADLTAADDPKNVKEETAGETPPKAAETPPAETPPPAEPAKIDAAAQLPGESDEKYEQRYRTLQGIHKHDRETWEAERTQLLNDLEVAKTKPGPEPVAKAPDSEKEKSAEAFVDSLTDEQKKQLEEYEQDFDVVSKMEGIKRSVELGKLRKEIQAWKDDIAGQINETRTKLASQIAPAVALAEDSERQSHFNAIRQGYTAEDGTPVPGHGDFEQYRDDGSLMKWIESKPKYIQPALKQTYEQGTAQDVIDLISDFKRDNNILNTQPSPDNVVNINPAKAARKQALTTVTTRRGAVNTGAAVPDDFEGAFDEAMRK